MPVLALAVVALLIVLNGFFAMAEMAVVSARRPRLAAMAEAGSKGARAALGLLENQARFLSSVQIGITLIGVLAGAFGGATLAEDLADLLEGLGLGPGAAGTVAVAVVVALITYLSLIVGELVPKQVALADPERVAALVAGPMALVARVAAPAVWLLEASSRLVLRLLGRGEGPERRVTEEEIGMLIAEAEGAGVVETAERHMIGRVMRLGDRSVRAVMTPRPELDWVDLDREPREALARLLASPHSRLPAARGGTIDGVVGVLHARDVLRAVAGGGVPDLAPLVREAPVLHDRVDALDALEALRRSPVDMAFVVDEHGTLEGVVTAADLLEAIAGRFAAREAEAEPDAVRREDGSWLLAGWKPVDEMAELLRLALPARREYHTVAGFVLGRLGRFPGLGDAAEHGGWRFE
ncbi:MAG TPA: hemolysin family protein, partial [Solirubrobacteraceae bacterium]|nr:hemolysin family protein [Solirubrobacteraceae bacterium]